MWSYEMECDNEEDAEGKSGRTGLIPQKPSYGKCIWRDGGEKRGGRWGWGW